MSKSFANDNATSLSYFVVVGDLNSKVSDKIQLNIKPFIEFGIFSVSLPIKSNIIVAVQASGLIVTLRGDLVFKPPTRRWWSIISIMSALITDCGNSDGLLVSTITILSFGETSSIISGFLTFQ